MALRDLAVRLLAALNRLGRVVRSVAEECGKGAGVDWGTAVHGIYVPLPPRQPDVPQASRLLGTPPMPCSTAQSEEPDVAMARPSVEP